VPEILPFIAFFLLGIPAPMTVILALLTDLGTDIFPAISSVLPSSPPDRLGWHLLT